MSAPPSPASTPPAPPSPASPPSAPPPPSPWLRILTPGELLRGAWALYTEQLAVFVGLAFVPQAVLLLVQLLLPAGWVSLFVALLLTVVGNTIMLCLIFSAGGALLLGHPPTLRAAFERLGRLPLLRIILTYLSVQLAVSVGLLLLYLPGVLIGGMLAPALALQVIEDRSLVDTWRQSWELVRGRLLQGILVFMFAFTVAVVLPLVFLILVGSGPFSPLIAALCGALLSPLASLAHLLFYVSCRQQLTADAALRLARGLQLPSPAGSAPSPEEHHESAPSPEEHHEDEDRPPTQADPSPPTQADPQTPSASASAAPTSSDARREKNGG